MDLSQIALDVPTLKLSLAVVGGLLLIAMVRILFLLRTNAKLRQSTSKMEQQVLSQQQAILSVRSDSNAWRGEMQRMFDSFRAESSKRLEESEQRYQDIQQSAGIISKPAKPVAFSAPSMPASFAVTENVELEESSVLPVPALNIS
ncbi:MAG: hypothetical protein K9N47_02230 [Prosthecobacter sp.]|uniref:hypothetical protein n=1 Tax=Prosthecobacter sp. TaxID=1965333 RepID=UPI00260025C1|nr:hypothetical protein [Prosthecobacter sp.]MCF7784906.1 hypothetical protein [Prosthecobacter sp.]